jgi:predicted nucleic acid-binding protein
MIILDTNVISEMQGRLHSERILAWLDTYEIEALFLTTISIGEMHYGLHLLEDGHRKIGLERRAAFLNPAIPLSSIL